MTRDPRPPPPPPPASPPNAQPPPPIPASFTRRKTTILAHLALPDEEYTDLSPKGSVDAGIRELIDEINAVEGFVTTSSCAGRVSVFLEGARAPRGVGQSGEATIGSAAVLLPSHQQVVVGLDNEDEEQEQDGARSSTVAGVGGKGGGGRWLFVSHEPVEAKGRLDSEPNIVAALLGMEEPIFDGKEGTGPAEMSGEDVRLIHFKFEPMVRSFLLRPPSLVSLSTKAVEQS